MKLPSPEQAIVDIHKLQEYCLNANHQEGKHKARVFAAALGITKEDAKWLRDRLLEAASTEEATLVSTTDFGSIYMLDFELKTELGMAIVRSGWIIRQGERAPRLTTCYVRQRK